MKPSFAVQTFFLIAGISLLGSCTYDTESTTSNQVSSEIAHSVVEKELLVGSWIDTSVSALHFTLFKDGSARSDNMKTLLYKDWNVEVNQITFTLESFGNGTSSTDTTTYTIERLTADELTLSKGTYRTTYTKQ